MLAAVCTLFSYNVMCLKLISHVQKITGLAARLGRAFQSLLFVMVMVIAEVAQMKMYTCVSHVKT